MHSLQSLACEAAICLDVVDILRMPDTIVDIVIDFIFDTLEEETSHCCHEMLKEFRLRVIRGNDITDGEWGFFKFFLRLNAKRNPCQDNDEENHLWPYVLWSEFGIQKTPTDFWAEYRDADI